MGLAIALMMQTQQRDPSEDEPSTHSERAPGRMLIWTEALKFLGVSKPKELMPAYAPSRQRARRLKDDSDPCFPTYKVMLSRDKTVRRFARARLFASRTIGALEATCKALRDQLRSGIPSVDAQVEAAALARFPRLRQILPDGGGPRDYRSIARAQLDAETPTSDTPEVPEATDLSLGALTFTFEFAHGDELIPKVCFSAKTSTFEGPPARHVIGPHMSFALVGDPDYVNRCLLGKDFGGDRYGVRLKIYISTADGLKTARLSHSSPCGYEGRFPATTESSVSYGGGPLAGDGDTYTGLGSVVKIPYSGEGRSVMMHLQFWQSFYNRAPMEPQRILCVLQNCLDAGGFPDPCGRYRLLSMGEEDPDSPSESDNYDY